ncbi:hypothetical protein LIG30_4282 [Burkholderia sp. lig30]|jgi:glucoamylase|nr:hypothetical protein LIG30_4282 [Burkholderia sp. lig30]
MCVQCADSADATNAHYESGLDIQTPSVRLPRRLRTRAIESTAACPHAYKWAWARVSGSTASFSPNNLPEYTPSSQDVSAIQNFGVYTVKLYDTTGTEIRSDPMNIAHNYAAAASGTLAWQTLGNNVIANYLTLGGSGTQSPSRTPATLDWMTSAGSLYPNFRSSINSLGAAQTSIPAATYGATVWGAGTGNTPSPFTFNTSFTDVPTSTTAATAEQAVQVQFGWQADGEIYCNTWQYGNP